MGIRIDGTADLIKATDGSLTVEGESVNTTGIVTASGGFKVGTAATIYSNGNATFSGIITAASHLYADQGHFTDHIYIADKIVHTGDTNTALRFPAADTITAETGGSERFRIDSGGNFGIGSNNPQVLLHIASATPTLRIQDTTNNFYSHISVDDSGSLTLDGDAGNGAGSSRIVFKTDGSEHARINNSGQLGIGTDPARTLQVFNGSANPQLNIKSATGGTCELQFGDCSDEVRANIIYNSGSDYLGFNGYNNTERMRIDSSGRLRIGNTTQTQYTAADDLIIGGGSGDTGLSIYSGSSDSGVIAFSDGTSDPAYRMGQILYSHNDNSMAFRTNGNTERVRIDSSGRLLIGTTSGTDDPWGYNAHFQLNGDSSGAESVLSIARHSADSGSPVIIFGKSRSTGQADVTVVNSGDALGSIHFTGADGSNWEPGASIIAYVDGTPASSGDGTDMPGRLCFYTTADGSDSLSERMRIHHSGEVTIPGGVTLGLSADSKAASNTLDDYEEGTFTPVVAGDGGTAGTWNSGGSHTGVYRKIGTLVFIAIQVSGSVSAAGNGNLQITGLPFTAATVTGGHGQALALGPLFNWDIADTAYQIGGRVNDNSTGVYFWNNYDNAADDRLGWPFGSSGTKYGSIAGCYIATT